MPGDNFHFNICSDSRTHFDMAVEIGFAGAAGGKAYSYKISPEKGIILSWQKEGLKDGYMILSYPLTSETAKNFLWDLLKSIEFSEKQPDHDGDNEKGFRIYNESWSRVDGNFYAFMAVRPEWQMYGK